VKFLIDNNLSRQLADGMRTFGEDVFHLQDHFEHDVKDEELLAFVGPKDFILISRDLQIRKRPAELVALKKHRVGAFFLGGKNRTRWELVQQLVRNWPRMKELAEKTSRPFAFLVPPSGTKIERLPL
jgi:predicted nuclease of predicted toxin-antitoxin system